MYRIYQHSLPIYLPVPAFLPSGFHARDEDHARWWPTSDLELPCSRCSSHGPHVLRAAPPCSPHSCLRVHIDANSCTLNKANAFLHEGMFRHVQFKNYLPINICNTSNATAAEWQKKNKHTDGQQCGLRSSTVHYTPYLETRFPWFPAVGVWCWKPLWRKRTSRKQCPMQLA